MGAIYICFNTCLGATDSGFSFSAVADSFVTATDGGGPEALTEGVEAAAAAAAAPLLKILRPVSGLINCKIFFSLNSELVIYMVVYIFPLSSLNP